MGMSFGDAGKLLESLSGKFSKESGSKAKLAGGGVVPGYGPAIKGERTPYRAILTIYTSQDSLQAAFSLAQKIRDEADNLLGRKTTDGDLTFSFFDDEKKICLRKAPHSR